MNIENIPGNHQFIKILDKLEDPRWVINIECQLCGLRLLISSDQFAIFPKGISISGHYEHGEINEQLNKLESCKNQMIKNLLE